LGLEKKIPTFGELFVLVFAGRKVRVAAPECRAYSAYLAFFNDASKRSVV
jgi:hypothetical protein